MIFKVCSKKDCSRKGQLLSETEFYCKNKKGDLLRSYCKDCGKKQGKKFELRQRQRHNKKTLVEIYSGEIKLCISCGESNTKTQENWNINYIRNDGLSNKCKKCFKNDIKLQVRYAMKGAKQRNLEVSLTKQQFIEAMLNPCFYCKSIDQKEHYDKFDPIFHGFNGLDRIDNSRGYLKENVVACCWKHNEMKSRVPLSLVRTVAQLASERGLS